MSSTNFNLKIDDYSEYSIVVRGDDTRKYKEDLKKLGGKYNSMLRGGPGWVFPKKNEQNIKKFINEGKRLVTDEEERIGEENTKKRQDERNRNKSCDSNDKYFEEIQNIKKQIDGLNRNIGYIENAITLLLSKNDKKKMLKYRKKNKINVLQCIEEEDVEEDKEDGEKKYEYENEYENENGETVIIKRLMR